MDISLIKLVLLVVSPTISITIIAINIHHHLALRTWCGLLWWLQQSFTRILQKWHSIGIQHFKLEDSPLGGAETFLILGGFDSIPRLAPDSLRNVIQLMVDISNWKTMENQFDPMMSICHVFHHLDPASHEADTALEWNIFRALAWIWSNVVQNLDLASDPQRDQKTMMLFMTVSYWIVFIGLDSSRKE